MRIHLHLDGIRYNHTNISFGARETHKQQIFLFLSLSLSIQHITLYYILSYDSNTKRAVTGGREGGVLSVLAIFSQKFEVRGPNPGTMAYINLVSGRFSRSSAVRSHAVPFLYIHLSIYLSIYSSIHPYIYISLSIIYIYIHVCM